MNTFPISRSLKLGDLRRATKPRRSRQRAAPALPKPLLNPQEEQALTQAARRFYGFPSLRHPQAEIMACVRRGEDVLAILPTGAGKSLCYQLPVLLDPPERGLTLVVSPLIALMKDQVDNLPAPLRQHAVAINSSLPDVDAAVRDVAAGRYRLVYVAPERLMQRPFLHALRQAGVARLVIDEAHCVSAWGHDFRPDYLNLSRIRAELSRNDGPAASQSHMASGPVPLLALTATAPAHVRTDMQQRLFNAGKRRPHVITADTFRPNLHLSAVAAPNKDEKLRHLLRTCHILVDEGLSTGIVYARSRRRCEELAALLTQQGLRAEAYHAGLQDRAAVQERFMRGETPIIASTIAFGMGVDKADIRFVVHDGLPDSVESYYQEAGRAGRDRQPARCILLHSPGDRLLLSRRASENLLDVDFLNALYDTLRTHLGAQPGDVRIVNPRDVRSRLKRSEVDVRVGLSLLEQAALLSRRLDVPRWLTLQATAPREGRFGDFAASIKLPRQRDARYPFERASELSGVSVDALEEYLLTWQAHGLLRSEPSGRGLLYTVHDTVPETRARIDNLLVQYRQVQQQRVDDIVHYATTTDCRHGALAERLGGARRERCGACDNCLRR